MSFVATFTAFITVISGDTTALLKSPPFPSRAACEAHVASLDPDAILYDGRVWKLTTAMCKAEGIET